MIYGLKNSRIVSDVRYGLQSLTNGKGREEQNPIFIQCKISPDNNENLSIDQQFGIIGSF